MDSVGVRELRQNLSRYLAQVREGESFDERLADAAAACGLPVTTPD